MVLELIVQDPAKIEIHADKLFFFVVATPLIEESLKFILIKKICFGQKCFNQIMDGVIYAVALSLGFAMFENFFYFASFLPYGVPTLAGGIILRTFSSTLLHTLSTGWLGYWIGRARFDDKNKTFFTIAGFSMAILIHAAFNFFLLESSILPLMFLLFITLDLLFVRLEAHESQLIREWVSPKVIEKIFKKRNNP